MNCCLNKNQPISFETDRFSLTRSLCRCDEFCRLFGREKKEFNLKQHRSEKKFIARRDDRFSSVLLAKSSDLQSYSNRIDRTWNNKIDLCSSSMQLRAATIDKKRIDSSKNELNEKTRAKIFLSLSFCSFFFSSCVR